AAMYDFYPAREMQRVASPYDSFTMRVREPLTEKIAFRAHLLAGLASGNHWVSQPVEVVHGVVRIRHYPFLDFGHFLEKARAGNAALAATDLPDNVGSHWREWARSDEATLAKFWGELLESDLVEDPRPLGPYLEE